MSKVSKIVEDANFIVHDYLAKAGMIATLKEFKKESG